MKIELHIFSILSIALVLLGILTSAPIELHSIGVSVSDKITIDPIFIIWSDWMIPANVYGYALGCAVVFNKRYRHHEDITLALQHEVNHVKQQRGLGLATPLAYFIGMNMEGDAWTSAEDFQGNLDSMWLPPFSIWSFLSIGI